MRSIVSGFATAAILSALASSAQAQLVYDYGNASDMYRAYSPMTWGTVAEDQNYSFIPRYQDYIAPSGFGPQNNAFTNTGLGSLVNGDLYDRSANRSLFPNGYGGETKATTRKPPAPVRGKALGRRR